MTFIMQKKCIERLKKYQFYVYESQNVRPHVTFIGASNASFIDRLTIFTYNSTVQIGGKVINHCRCSCNNTDIAR